MRSRKLLAGVNHGRFNRTTSLATSSPALIRCQRFVQVCKSVADGCAQRHSRTTELRFFLPCRARLLPTPTLNLAQLLSLRCHSHSWFDVDVDEQHGKLSPDRPGGSLGTECLFPPNPAPANSAKRRSSYSGRTETAPSGQAIPAMYVGGRLAWNRPEGNGLWSGIGRQWRTDPARSR